MPVAIFDDETFKSLRRVVATALLTKGFEITEKDNFLMHEFIGHTEKL